MAVHQEAGRRAGTENVAGIIGMGTASDISTAHQKEHTLLQQKLRDHLMNRILSEIPMTRLNGSRQERLPGNINVSFAGIDSATLIAMLEAKDIYVSGRLRMLLLRSITVPRLKSNRSVR